MISRVCAIVLAAGVLGAAHAPDPPAAFKVIGYYADWTSPTDIRSRASPPTS